MSFVASLKLDDTSYKLLDCNLRMSQPLGTNMKPSGKVQGGSFSVSLELAKNTNVVDWMANSTITKNGEVIFYKRDALSRNVTISFQNAYCTDLNLDYHAFNNQPLKVTITITAEILKINNIEHKNNW